MRATHASTRSRVRRRIGPAVAVITVLSVVAPAAAHAAKPLPGPGINPRVSIGSGSVIEGSMNRRFIRFTVSLSWPSTETVTVDYDTVDGDATAPTDYREKHGTVTLKPRATSQYLAVNIWPDGEIEGDHSFTMELSNPAHATLGNDVGVGTIIDDDPNVGTRIGIGDVTVAEGCYGRTGPIRASAILALSRPAGGVETVQVTTSPGTASAGSDYTTYSKAVTLTAGQLLKEIKVPIVPDLDIEGPETFNVDISLISGPAKVGRAHGTVTILDCQPTS
jgi:hypothetical protein